MGGQGTHLLPELRRVVFHQGPGCFLGHLSVVCANSGLPPEAEFARVQGEAGSGTGPRQEPPVETLAALPDAGELGAAGSPCSRHPWARSLSPKEIEDVHW